MKSILLISTGGTISSVPSDTGLIPTDAHNIFQKLLISDDTKVDSVNIFTLDSSNVQPEEWQILSKKIYEELDNYDGIIVTHGTDTMSYTASMISFMVQNPNKPIVFTGSQLPINHPLTDAFDNLKAALAMAKTGLPGVFLAFDRKILLGSRTVKVRTSNFKSFESINLLPLGEVSASGLIIHEEMINFYKEKPVFKPEIDTNVFLLKITPTTNPNIINLLVDSGVHGIVIEAFGAGGLPYIRRDFVTEIKKAIDREIPVVVTSQCLYERSNFNIYEVGTKVIKSGAIEAYDMTTEACVTKLMHALGQTSDLNEIKKIFYKPIANEIKIIN